MSTSSKVRSALETPNGVPEELYDGMDLMHWRGRPLAVKLSPVTVAISPECRRLSPESPTLMKLPCATDDLIGRQCGGYVIDALLGEGGMGKVYRATNHRMGKRAAIKVILPEHSRNPRVVDRFFQEAKAAAQIDDPNIVDVLEASELEDGRAFLLMPFVEGSSLEELCDHVGRLPLEMAAAILFQICGGLDAAHYHGIVHRDIKPQNILVGPRQQRTHFVRIVDFGIAKLMDPCLAGKFKTQARTVMGTPGYMAPEQARGEHDVDTRADIYAVAVVAYRMLTGRRPYMAETLYTLIENQACNVAFPRPRDLRPEIPVAWDEAIMAALISKREKRLGTVREFAQRLARGLPQGDQMLRALAPRLAASPLPPHAATLDPFLDHDIARRMGARGALTSPRRRTFGLLGLAFLLLGLGGGICVFLYWSARQEAAADLSSVNTPSTEPRRVPGCLSPTGEASPSDQAAKSAQVTAGGPL